MKYTVKINSEFMLIKQNTKSENMSPPLIQFHIIKNSKNNNLNLNLICCKEQIVFGLMRLKNLEYNIRDKEKRLLDFIYGKRAFQKITELNAELIFEKDNGTKEKDGFDYNKNFKDNKERICKYYGVNPKLENEEIKKQILEKINLSFLK